MCVVVSSGSVGLRELCVVGALCGGGGGLAWMCGLEDLESGLVELCCEGV